MIRHLTTFRFRQLWRYIEELGIIRVLFFLPFLVLLGAGIVQSMLQDRYLELIFVGYIFVLFNIQLQRNDKHFLRLTHLPEFTVYFSEYAIYSIPLMVLFAFSAAWYFSLLLLPCIALIAMLKQTISLKFQQTRIHFPFIPAELFEWKSGLRKNGLFILIVFLPGIIFSRHLFVIPAVLAITGLIMASFYLEGEAKEMLQATRLSSRQLLLKKITLHLSGYLILALPLAGLFLIQNTAYWYLIVYVLMANVILQAFSIIFKYALYNPGENLQNNMILIGFCVVCFLIPFLLPIPLILIMVYYPKSIRNLKTYLNA